MTGLDWILAVVLAVLVLTVLVGVWRDLTGPYEDVIEHITHREADR